MLVLFFFDVEETLNLLILVSLCKHVNGKCIACVVEDGFEWIFSRRSVENVFDEQEYALDLQEEMDVQLDENENVFARNGNARK